MQHLLYSFDDTWIILFNHKTASRGNDEVNTKLDNQKSATNI